MHSANELHFKADKQLHLKTARGLHFKTADIDMQFRR